MHTCNPYANALVAVGEVLRTNPHAYLKMVICESHSTSKQYLAPTAGEIAAVMPRHGDDFDVGNHDIHI